MKEGHRALLRFLFVPRVTRWSNDALGQLDGVRIVIPFFLGMVAIHFCARDAYSYTLCSGFDIWLWPRLINIHPGDRVFRYHWRVVDKILFNA